MKIRISIIGSGDVFSIAHFHTLALKQIGNVEIVGVYNRTLERSKEFIKAHELENALAYQDCDEMLEASDGVLICTPSNAHTQYIMKALEKNVAVFSEKPLAVDFSECEKLAATAKKLNAKTMVGFDHRYSVNAAFVKKLLKEKFKQIFNLSMTYGAQRIANPEVHFEWRMDKQIAGFGATQDFGSHMIDLMRFMTGIEIDKISCLTSTSIKAREDKNGQLRKVENDDSSVISAVGTKDEMCSFVMSRIGFEPLRVVVSGDGGIIKTDFAKSKVTYLRKNLLGGYTGEKEDYVLPSQKYFDDFFLPQMRDFCRLVSGDHVEVCDFENALQTQKILHFAELSAEDQKVKKVL